MTDTATKFPAQISKYSRKARKGEAHGRSLLTANDVDAIRKWAADLGGEKKTLPFTAKAREYNVSEASIRDIVANRTWRHLESGSSCVYVPTPTPTLELSQGMLESLVELFLGENNDVLPKLDDVVPGMQFMWRAIDKRLLRGDLGEKTSLRSWLRNNYPVQAKAIGGNRYGMLSVIRYVSSAEARSTGSTFGYWLAGYWLALCDCGKLVRRQSVNQFISGRAYSCGCSKRRSAKQA